MISIICSECSIVFTWSHPTGGRHGGNPPGICGKPGKDGKWIPTPDCKKSRQAKLYVNWVKNNPQKAKANQHKQYKKRKQNQELQEYKNKDVPEVKQWKCKRCGRWSSGRINCPACLTILTNRCSMEHPAFIYNQSNDDTDKTWIDIKTPLSHKQ